MGKTVRRLKMLRKLIAKGLQHVPECLWPEALKIELSFPEIY